MIPKIIHQVWVGHYQIPEREEKLLNDIKDKNPDYQHILWTDNNLPIIPEKYKEMYDKMYSQKDYVYCADMLRLLAVQQYGGFYLDIDWEHITGFNNLKLENRSGIVFGHWGVGWQHCDYTLTNNVFGFEKEHPMITYVTNNMPIDLGYCNAPYSPGWFGLIVKQFMELENQFHNEIWEYHRIMRENLEKWNVEYGDYNTFQNENFKHYALYSWSLENKAKWEQGLFK